MASARGRPGPRRRRASPVFAVRRSVLADLPPGSPLDAVPARPRGGAGRRRSIPAPTCTATEPWTPSPRDDLAANVPAGARAVLDVGCSAGRDRRRAARAGRRVRIGGIEPDAGDARAAARRLRSSARRAARGRPRGVGSDDSTPSSSATCSSTSPTPPTRSFACGPGSPSAASWSPRCRMSATGPSSTTSSRGRFDYVPYSILSGTHVRFFTRSHAASTSSRRRGYRVERIGQRDPAGFSGRGGAARSSRGVARSLAGPGRRGVSRRGAARRRLRRGEPRQPWFIIASDDRQGRRVRGRGRRATSGRRDADRGRLRPLRHPGEPDRARSGSAA